MRLLRFALLLLCACAAQATFAQEYRRALPGYAFDFPRDHGSHPEFRTEWWYFTGNVADAGGARFGYELTVFRQRLAPRGGVLDAASRLAADEVFLAHFAISDIGRREHRNWERIGREGLGQARASAETLDVQCQDWTVRLDADGAILLDASAGGEGLKLRLAPARPHVIHGEDGIHRKAEDAGQASHYVSFTRLETTGTIRRDGREVAVSGLSWMDHEFGSDQLGARETGWDWFALQLDSGEDLMVYRLRREDGSYNPFSSGTLVNEDATTRTLANNAFAIEPLGAWKSPKSGAQYPMGWSVAVPSEDGDLRVEPAFEAQEMDTRRTTGTVYWEGAVTVTGRWRGRKAKGRGYVELVGYAAPFRILGPVGE